MPTAQRTEDFSFALSLCTARRPDHEAYASAVYNRVVDVPLLRAVQAYADHLTTALESTNFDSASAMLIAETVPQMTPLCAPSEAHELANVFDSMHDDSDADVTALSAKLRALTPLQAEAVVAAALHAHRIFAEACGAMTLEDALKSVALTN